MFQKKHLLLIVIVLLAFLLRFYKVTEVPPSLNWDELSIGYNAYSILKTGRDEWGKFLPIHFKAYGEYKLPVQIYASIPAIAVFGLNDFSIRITPVIYGTLTVLFLFLLTQTLFKNFWIGLTSAFLLSISPWHLQLTRASFESSFSVFWFVLGLWSFVKGIDNRRWWLLAVAAWAFAIYTYNTARVFVPLFLLTNILLLERSLLKINRWVVLSLSLFIVLLLPLIPFYFSGEGSARYKLVSITDEKGLIPRINENRGNSNLPGILPRLVHNKATYLSLSFAENYLAHFTPDFLFISGAPHKQHHVQGIGELFLFQVPFLLLGIYQLLRQNKSFKWMLISWLLLSFIPVSITNDSIPHALRTVIAVPFYQILSAFGIYQAALWLKKQAVAIRLGGAAAGILVLVISLASYFNLYYNLYPKLYSKDWQYGYKEALEYIKDHQDQYDEVVMTRSYGEPHMFTLFYLNYDPQRYQEDPGLIRYETNDWVWVLRFGKYYFPDLGDPGTKYEDIIKSEKGKKLLIVGKPGDFPIGTPVLKTVSFLNHEPAFMITEYLP